MGDWIPLLVRREDYPELAALVAEREAVRPDAQQVQVVTTEPSAPLAPSPNERTEAGQLALHAPWPLADLERLATSPALIAHRLKAAMDICAAQPGVFVPEDRLAELMGIKAEEWSSATRAMRRHLDAYYGGTPGRPLVTVAGRTIGRDDDRQWWAITEEQARRWADARTEIPQPRRPRPPLPEPLLS
jgi:hypothetical protein